MKKELRECFKKKESGLFGGYSKEAYIQEVVKYIFDRYEKKMYSERPAQTQNPKKKTRLSSFENFTETTSLNKCTLCVVVPNAGLIAEIVGRIMAKKSVLGEDIKTAQYKIIGDENDDFMLPMMYTGTGFEETYNMQADIVILTTKALVSFGDKKIDRSKYFINTTEELEDFTRKAKQDLNVYAFLSGVDTVILLDADILLIQNSVAFYETLKILEEAKPAPKQYMNLRYLSSGEEKKSFIFLGEVIPPKLVSFIEKMPSYVIVSKKECAQERQSSRQRESLCSPYKVCLKANRHTSPEKYAEHHITNLSNDYERSLVIVRDSVEMEAIKAEIQNASGYTAKTILFIDEFTTESKIKEELKKGCMKRVWVITERFIFYRRKRLPRILTPYNPIKVFAPYIVNPKLLQTVLIKVIDPQDTEHALYNSPIILTVSNDAERYFISEICGRPVALDQLFEYTDEVIIE
ncbi:hypothetical protein NEIG_00442 [Nematocida sp. ERTm5]|nr:hypothetical protein NEIG_00442 [Nematocida sp. ERTm5]